MVFGPLRIGTHRSGGLCLPPQTADQQMRLPGRLGEAIPPAAGQRPSCRGPEADPVPDRDIQRADLDFCPKDVPNGAPPRPFRTPERNRRSPLPAGRRMFSVEAAFRAADRGDIKEKAQVRGQPTPAGMRYPLAVHKQEIRPMAKAGEQIQEQGDFPECQEAGNVGKGEASRSPLFLHHTEIGITQDHNACPGPC